MTENMEIALVTILALIGGIGNLLAAIESRRKRTIWGGEPRQKAKAVSDAAWGVTLEELTGSADGPWPLREPESERALESMGEMLHWFSEAVTERMRELAVALAPIVHQIHSALFAVYETHQQRGLCECEFCEAYRQAVLHGN